MRGTHVLYIPNLYTGNIYRNIIHENISKNSRKKFPLIDHRVTSINRTSLRTPITVAPYIIHSAAEPRTSTTFAKPFKVHYQESNR